jgi:hypothetical protein
MKKLLLFVALLFTTPAFAQAPQMRATVNGSVVIATGNTFQTALAAATAAARRNSLTIQNNNATDSCWIFIGSAAATKGTSMLLLAGQGYSRYYPYIPSDVIQATCASTSDTLYVDTQ